MHTISPVLLAILITAFSVAFGAEQEPQAAMDLTPPRLSHIEGVASFWRPGAEDWTPARVNTPLAPGDALYTGERTTLEIQVGARAFVRAAEKTHFGVVNLEPDFLQLKLTAGAAALDLRSLPPGYTVELDTPNAVFTMEHPGYYRAEVAKDSTHFITRRSGRASVTAGDRTALTVASSEEIVVRGTTAPTVEAYVAPVLDSWDQWNYARTEYELESLSRRYLSPGIYGAAELDRHGAWRVVPSYGSVWVPYGTPPGWAPYSTGSWVWDPYYGWTWVDDAAWGWAPFHYGRWVYLDGIWAWAPGPVIVRPLYAPALVAFFSVGRGASVGIGILEPAVGWVALVWGEALYPWWGGPGFVGVPWWGGWGGPRIGHAGEIIHHNARVPHAVVAIDERRFGRGPTRGTRFTITEQHEVRPLHGAPPLKPDAASFAAGRGRAMRPPAAALARPSVATRPPPQMGAPSEAGAPARKPPAPGTAPVIVAPPRQQADHSAALPRPAFGDKGRERAGTPPPPRFNEKSRAKPAPPAPRQQPAPAARGPREARPSQPSRALPGRPANETAPRAPGKAGSAPERPSRARDR